MNLQIRTFEEDVAGIFNKSSLPIEVKRLVLVEVLRKVEIESNKIILHEKEVTKDAESVQTDKLGELSK